LFLLDERQEALVGRMGIGHLVEAEALADWERPGRNSLEDFKWYLEQLAQGTLEPTPVDEKIRGLQFPLRSREAPDLFSRTVAAGYPVHVSQEEDLGALPVAFRDAFQPAVPLVVAPLKVRGRVIGLLVTDNKFLKSPVTSEDVESLVTFANTAAIAIDNARLLHTTTVTWKARTAVALLGMASAIWRHGVDNDATTIQDLVHLLRSELDAGGPVGKLQQRLDTIDALAKRIRETPITAPLSTEEGAESVLINNLVRERVRQLQLKQSMEREQAASVQYRLTLAGEDHVVVRASTEWLKRAFDILVDNAIEAMATSVTKDLVVTTRVIGNGVEISIRDTGRGIPADVRPQLFHEPIKKPKGAKGMGMGLLQAQTIVQTYGGEIRIGDPSSAGTTMVIWLPLEV
jgi:signal transduction histidine kinase